MYQIKSDTNKTETAKTLEDATIAAMNMVSAGATCATIWANGAYVRKIGAIKTQEQIIAELGLTKKTAPKMNCHYCGMTATSFGFFGEPVCHECGG